MFNDAIHGHIRLHPLCVLVIDTPQFQRLRYLSQLGGTYYVFPSASHKRFEHSLGVAYLAEQLVTTLRQNQPELGITDVDVVCVSLAGLCHDLGHGPFSHLWERFMQVTRPQRNWKHEESSVEMFRYLLRENDLMPQFRAAGLSEQDVLFIEEQIAGPRDGHQYKGRTGNKVFLYEVISNKRNGIDVDKWDYFCRDSAALGITISFDYKRCLLYSRVIKVDGEDYQICTRDKEAGNLYDLFYTRWVLHRRAYQHRVSRIVERMIIDILCGADAHLMFADAEGELSVRMSEAVDHLSVFTNLTDHVLQLVASSPDVNLLPARQLLHQLHTRQLYRFIGSTQALDKCASQIDTEEVRRSLGSMFTHCSDGLCADDLLIEVVSVSYGMGDKNPIDCVRFYSKHTPDSAQLVKQAAVSALLPSKFRETFIMAVCRVRDPEKVVLASQRFDDWCRIHHYSTPSREMWFDHVPALGPTDATTSH